MAKKKSIQLLVILLGFLSEKTFAQSANYDMMRSMGKMYVVVAVVVSIFIGIVIYLIRLDKKLTRLEKQINNNE
ncbi:MAG: CcmD family protein [Saprospiraceae bacterium]